MKVNFKFNGSRSGSRFQIGMLSVAAMLITSSSATQASQSASLAWNASSDSAVAGYVLYAGSSPTNYTSRMDVGTNTTATVTGLKEGHTNYFAVTAYNTAKMESTLSGQITYLVPGLLVLSGGSPSPSGPRMNFPTAVGHWYEVQASTNLKSWATVWQTASATTNQWVGYQDTQAPSFQKRFYRLVLH